MSILIKMHTLDPNMVYFLATVPVILLMCGLAILIKDIT